MTGLIGNSAEEIAEQYLQKIGFTILARNVVFPFGELDLVACRHNTVVFVEVKYRRNVGFGQPFEAVGLAKQKKIIRAANAFLQRQKGPLPACRFDVLSLSGDLKDPVIDHLEDAFWDEGS